MEIRKMCSCGFMGKDKDVNCINCGHKFDGNERVKYKCETCKKFKFEEELNGARSCKGCKSSQAENHLKVVV